MTLLSRLLSYLRLFLADNLKRLVNCNPETAFLIIGCVAGTASVFLTPPLFGGSLDEHKHFLRSYQVSDLVLAPIEDSEGRAGGHLPRSLKNVRHFPSNYWPGPSDSGLDVSSIIQEFSKPLEKNEKAFFAFSATRVYSFVAYLPSAAGIAMGKLFNLPGIALMYLGRLSSLAIWISVMYWAIRKTPRFGLLLMVMALSPYSVNIGSSISADTMTNSFSFLLIGCVLNAAFEREKVVSQGTLVLICTVAAVLLMCKQGYITLIVLPLLIPPKRFGSTRRYLSFFTVYFLISGLIFTGAFFYLKLTVGSTWILSSAMKITSNPLSNFEYIIDYPLVYGRAILSTIAFNCVPQDGHLIFRNWPQTFVMFDGTFLFRLPLWFVFIHYGLYYAASCSCISQGRRMMVWERVLILCVFVGGVIVIITVCYLGWSGARVKIIPSVQARYFIPLGPLAFIFIAIRYRGAILSPKIVRICAYSFVLISLVVTQILVVRFYYAAKDNLIPNGNFAIWSTGDLLPLGWSIGEHTDPSELRTRIKRIDNEDFSGGVGVEQTWRKSDDGKSQFILSTTISGLSPKTWHHLYTRTNGSKRGVQVLPIEVSDRTRKMKPRWMGWNLGHFFSDESGVVTIGAWCPKATIENPVVIEWNEWVLVELR